MRRLVIVAVAAATLVTALGAPASPVADRTHRVPAADLRLALPGTWKALNAKSVFNDQALAEAVEANPNLQGIIAQLASPSSPVKFFAIDPKLRDRFATNVNVVVAPLPRRMSQAEFLRGAVSSYGALEIRNERFASVRLPAGQAVQAILQLRFGTPSGKRWVSVRQYSFMHDGSAVTVTYTTLPEAERGYRPAFVASARSIRFTG